MFQYNLNKKVYPQANVIQSIQDKSNQKKFYQNNGIPTSSFQILNGIDEIKTKIRYGFLSN